MNIQLDDEEESSSKTPEYFLPAGLTDDDTESGSETTGGAPELTEQPTYSYPETQEAVIPSARNTTLYHGKVELSREESTLGSSYPSSAGRTVVSTPVAGGLFHRTLSSYQSEALNPPLVSLEGQWRNSFSNNAEAPVFSTSGQYYPQSSEVLATSPPVSTGPVQMGVGFSGHSRSSPFYGPNSLTGSPYSAVPMQQSYVNSFISPSYSPQAAGQPSGSVIGSAFLIPDDSSTSSFTSYADASVFPFSGDRELSSSQHSSGYNGRFPNRKKLCRYFPNCPHGDSCKFYHPSGADPAFAMTAEANLSHPGRPRTGSWGGIWSSNAAMEWMHAVIQRHNFFSFAHRHKNPSSAVVGSDPVVYGDRMEDTSKEHRSTIGSIFHPAFIVGNRHRNVAKNETSSKNAEKQMKKSAKKGKKDKGVSSSSGKENGSASQPSSFNTNRSLSSSEKSPSGNNLSDNSNTLSTSSAALSGTTEDGNDQPRKLTRAEKRRLRAIRFYENKRRAAEEAKRKQKVMEQTTDRNTDKGETSFVEEEKCMQTFSSKENEKACFMEEASEYNSDRYRKDNTTNESVTPSQQVDANSVGDRNEDNDSDIFYDADTADISLSWLENKETSQEKENVELDISRCDDEERNTSVENRKEICQNEAVLSSWTPTTQWRESFSSAEYLKSSRDDSCKEQLAYWDSVVVGGDLHCSFYSTLYSFIWNLLLSICRFESGSCFLCFFVLYMFPILSTVLTYLVPRPLSANSLWFLLLMTHFWSWRNADNLWKKIFPRFFIPLYFLLFGFSHLTVIDQLTSMERILLAYLLCIIRSGYILTKEVFLVLCIQFILLELIESQPLWLQMLHFVGAVGYVYHLHLVENNYQFGRS